MNVRELEEVLDKVEDKSLLVLVSVGNLMRSENFNIEDVFTDIDDSEAIFILVFAKGHYDFGG